MFSFHPFRNNVLKHSISQRTFLYYVCLADKNTTIEGHVHLAIYIAVLQVLNGKINTIVLKGTKRENLGIVYSDPEPLNPYCLW